MAKKKKKIPSCGNCLFGKDEESNYSAPTRSCVRFPPQQPGTSQVPERFPFPIVSVDTWCGEYKPNVKESDNGKEEKEKE